MSYLMNFMRQAPPGETGQASGHDPVAVKQIETLLHRIQSSAVSKDRREALVELSEVPSLWNAFNSSNITLLMHVLRENLDDSEVTTKIVEIFSTITDSSSVTNDRLRESFLHEMQDPKTFLIILREQSFWPKYFIVQILSRLNDYDPSQLQKELLASNGVGALVDLLNDSSNGGALRNEGLILLNSITATNPEVQTILAFENCFDSLFHIIREEQGILGDIIVKDCLTIVQNMLRNNKATQKLFNEMGFVNHLVPLLVGEFSNGGDAVNFQPMPITNEIIFAAMLVLMLLLRGADANGEGQTVRTALSRAKVLHGLCHVALSPVLEVSTCIEGLRLIASTVQHSKVAAETLLSIKVRLGNSSASVDAVWSVLRYALLDRDESRRTSAMHVMVNFLEAGGHNAATFLTKSFHHKVTGQTQLHAGTLLGSALFSPNPATSVTIYHAAWILYQCLMIPPIAEYLMSLALDEENGTTFLPYFVKYLMSVIQGRQAPLASLGGLLRVLLTMLRFNSKALFGFLSDGSNVTFFVNWALQARDPIHLQYLSASVVVMCALMCPYEGLPPSVTFTRNDLISVLQNKIGFHKYNELLYNVSATVDWQHPPSNAALSPTTAIYDAEYIKTLQELHEFVQALVVHTGRESATSSRSASTTGQANPPEATQEIAAEQSRSNTVSPPLTSEVQTGVHQSAQVSELQVQQVSELQVQVQQLTERLQQQQKHLEVSQSHTQSLEQQISNLQTEKQQWDEEKSQWSRSQENSGALVETLEHELHEKTEELQAMAKTMQQLEVQLQKSGGSSNGGHEEQSHDELRAQLQSCIEERDELLMLVAELDAEREQLGKQVENNVAESFPDEY